LSLQTSSGAGHERVTQFANPWHERCTKGFEFENANRKMNTSQAKIPIVEIGEYVFSVGGAGDSPVPSGDPPDGIGRGIERKGAVLSQPHVTAIPPGGSPGGRAGRPHHPR